MQQKETEYLIPIDLFDPADFYVGSLPSIFVSR